jgi:hypothetical protein
MVMNLDYIYENTSDENKAFLFAINLRLIDISRRPCYNCGGNMNFERGKIRHSVNGRLRCGRKPCRKSLSIYVGTIFEDLQIPLSKALRSLYLYCSNFSFKNIGLELDLHQKTAAKFIKKTLNIFNNLNRNELYRKLGENLPNTIVEIDETHIVSRRDGRGRILRGEKVWVIGAICRITKMIRLKIVKRRNKNVCEKFARNKISQGTTIITDCWSGYRDLNWCGFDHHSVNHSENFVDPNIPWVHTQNIERLWRSLKESINLKSNKMKSLLTEIRRFEFMHNFGAKTSVEKFNQLILLNSV